MRRAGWWFGVLPAGLLLAAVASRAFAQESCCRLTTDESVGLECHPDPEVTRLHWDRSCLRYGFVDGTLEALSQSSGSAGVSPGERLTPERVREVFDRSFDAWLGVSCGGQPPDFYVEQMTEALSIEDTEFVFEERNEMAVVAHAAEDWERIGHNPNAFAVTSIWLEPGTGRIYDADIELNLGQGPFADCARPCTRRNAVDLGNTVTHEVGHLFGLAHSELAGSTMFASAQPGEIDKRELLPSDEECFCSVYPPGSLPPNPCREGEAERCQCGPPPIYEAPRNRGGCSCHVASGFDTRTAARGAPWLMLVTLGLWWRTRRYYPTRLRAAGTRR